MGTTFNSINKPGTYRFEASGTFPPGFLSCDGSAISRAAYAQLFSEIGVTYGVGDGSTTFNIPDFRGRTPVASGAGISLTARTLGDTLGEEDHTLLTSEMATHSHNSGTLVTNSASPTHQHNTVVSADPSRNIFGFGTGGLSVFGSSYSNSSLRHLTDAQDATHSHTITGSTNSVGTSSPHNNMQPSLVCQIGIKY